MMIQETYQVQVVVDEEGLALDELCRLAGVTQLWVHQRVDDGLLEPQRLQPLDTPHFNAADLRRVIRMASLERDFDAVPELASLVVALEQEVAALRAKLRRLGE
jgi:chaperone modulatory protein CbpM